MPPIEIHAEHETMIREHAQLAFPHECCGFLLGQDEPERRRIARVIEAVNSCGNSEQHHRFSITPEASMNADKNARASGLDMLGFYHSHPNAPARPSEYDLEHAWPVYSYLIVSVRDGKPTDMTCWVLRDDRGGFDAQSIEIENQ